MKPLRIVAVLAIVVVTLVLVRGPSTTAEPIGPAERVLILSVPTLTWDDVADAELPNISALLERSAVASASVRTIGIDTSLAEGYATIGAGNRAAIANGYGGLAFPPEASYDDELVRDVHARRFGVDAEGASVLHIGAAAIQRRNDDLLYDTEVGALGDALAEAGMSAGVVANADPEAETAESLVQREAALAVMDGVGRVTSGRVDTGLLDDAVDTPTGIALDDDVVVEATADALAESEVVLVELSDILRAESVEEVVTPEVAEEADAAALASTDELVGRLGDLVDPERDLVILVSPIAPAGPDQLVVAAMAGPGVEPGLARSGTARRDGYVTLPDIGPTVLDALDVDKPGAMNGAPMASAGGDAPDPTRFAELADDNVRALFRNDFSGPLTVLFIISQVLTYGLAAYALSNERMAWCRTASFVLLAGMALPFVSFALGVFPYHRLGVGGALLVSFAVACAVAFVVRRVVGRVHASSPDPYRSALDAPIVVTAATALLLVGDIAVGGPLQIDTAFGYGGGAIVAGRLAGYGNLAWSLMVASLIIVVTAVWSRWRMGADEVSPEDERFATGLAAAVFVLGVLAVGLPALGSNVGGTISTVAGLSITLLVLRGVRLDLRRLIGVGVVTVAVLGVFAAIDYSRPAEDQTHLGRLVDRTLGDEGLSGFGTVIERKINANLNILFSSVWALIIPAALGFLAFLLWRPPRFLRNLFEAVPGMYACVVGVLATGVIAGVVNDSGIAIPATMLTLLLPHVAYVIVEAHRTAGAAGRPGP